MLFTPPPIQSNRCFRMQTIAHTELERRGNNQFEPIETKIKSCQTNGIGLRDNMIPEEHMDVSLTMIITDHYRLR